MSGQRMVLTALLMVVALSAIPRARTDSQVCPGMTLVQLENWSEYGGITMAWRLDPGVSDGVYGFRMIFQKGSIAGFEINQIWGAEVLSISEAEVVPTDGNQVQFLVRVQTNSEWAVDLFGFNALVKTAYVKYDLLECNKQVGVFDEPLFVPYLAKAVPSCSWMTQSQFHDWSNWGGITVEYKTDPGMADAKFTFRVVVQNGEAPTLSIGKTWNADIDFVSQPVPVEGNPDQLEFIFLLKTHSGWDVDLFGFNLEINTRYVSHEVVDCPIRPGEPPIRRDPPPVSRGVPT